MCNRETYYFARYEDAPIPHSVEELYKNTGLTANQWHVVQGVRRMKKRLDVYLTEQGFAPSRKRAKAIIMSGCVFVDNQKAEKAGLLFGRSDSRGQG